MGWLLELLLDGIREICSQFIVDMMELVTEMFTELLSCNLSLFEELFSVVSVLYKNVIVPMGIAILLLILVWQLFKSMFGNSVNSEEPIELIIRSAIALFFVVGAKPVVDYVLRVAGTPYQWVVGTKIKVESFSSYVSALEGVTDALGIGKLSISLLMLIMQFVVAWNYFKMLFVIAERYVLLGVFSYTAPLAFSTGGSKSTNNILASWSKMFGGQVVLIILNAWCMKMFLSGYGNLMASSYGFTKFFVATLCLVGFCKITFKLDSYMASLGVNLGRPSPGMGAMGLIMAASRIISQIGHGASGYGGTGTGSEAAASGTSSSNMAEGYAGPIPMMSGASADGSMGMADKTSENDFHEDSDPSDGGTGTYGDFSYPSEQETKTGSVLEELGVVSAEQANSAGIDPGLQTGVNSGIGRTDDSRYSGEPDLENAEKNGTDGGNGTDGLAKDSVMDLNTAGIPSYEAANDTDRDRGFGENMAEGEDSQQVSFDPGYGTGSEGIISELGDYPVEEDMSENADEAVMELEGNTIDSMGNGMETEGISYGNAGDAFGNAKMASSSSRVNANSAGNSSSTGVQEQDSFGMPGGILGEVGADFETGNIDPYKKESGLDDRSVVSPDTEAAYSDMDLEGNGGAVSSMGLDGNSRNISGMNRTVPENSMEERNGIVSELSHGGDENRKVKNSEDSIGEMNDFESNPEMEGSMNPMGTGETIPSGNQKESENGKSMRGIREVPHSREELRRMQQNKNIQKPTDGMT